MDRNKLEDVRFALVYSAYVNFENVSKGKQKWKQLSENGNGYKWVQEDDMRKINTIEDELPEPLNDFFTVESFFLSKQWYRGVRKPDPLRTSRVMPSLNCKITFLLDQEKNGRKLSIEPTIIITRYQGYGVMLVTLSFEIDKIDADDLIYIKSLKLHSSSHYNVNTPKIILTLDGEDKSIKLSDLFEEILDHIFDDNINIVTPTDAILDSIELRGENLCSEIYKRNRDDLLFGILKGDEGYRINRKKIMQDYLDNPKYKFSYRDYFKYFFDTTSILGVFSNNYPEIKQNFAQKYEEKFGSFDPLIDYIDLVSDLPNLSDGHLFSSEIMLVSYTLLKDADQMMSREIKQSKLGGTSQEICYKDIEKEDIQETKNLDLDDLSKLKMRVMDRIQDIELFSNELLWVNLTDFPNWMFGYNFLKENLKEKLDYLDRIIEASETRSFQIQNRILSLLALLFAVLGIGEITTDFAFSYATGLINRILIALIPILVIVLVILYGFKRSDLDIIK